MRYPLIHGVRHSGATLALGLSASLCAILLALAAPGAASAHGRIALHAKLTHADPGIGAVLNSAPSTITLQFGEDMKPDGSDIVVYDDKGKQVSTGRATVKAGDAKTMTVGMQGDDSETYVVYYRTVSADDGDAYADSYQFTVSKDATASPGTQPGSQSTPSGTQSSGVDPLVAALIGLVGLIVGAAGGVFFARNQRPA
jgi:methionine-rich copper-binding protein CopC